MAISEYLELVFFSLLITLFLYYVIDRKRKNPCDLTNWPLVGMAPGFIQDPNDMHNKITELLSTGDGTFWFRGPWFCNMDVLLTSNPQDIQHIFSKNFQNYPKGADFKDKFEILGEGVVGSDYALWEMHRRTLLPVLSGSKFHNVLETSIWQKIETGLIPVLDHFCKMGDEFDIEDVFKRLTFDVIFQVLVNYDPSSLSLDLPTVPCQKAFWNVQQPLLLRYIRPRSVWKMMKFLKLGSEKQLMDSWIAFDDLIYSSLPLAEMGTKNKDSDLLVAFTRAHEENRDIISGDLKRFLRDTLLSLLFAGSDTTSACLTWLFWLVANNPPAGIKILQEMERELGIKQDGSNWRSFTVEESHKLVYLHGAINESLRLFPPLPIEYKTPVKGDNLPSGHYVPPGTKIAISFYTVGRMEKLWGKDCLEFKPERWITPQGGLRVEPSYKFPAFNVGPRMCMGKEMAVIEVKMAAASLIYHYNVKLIEGHQVVPVNSFILHAKNGVRVVLSKRK